ncbi:MAG: hypothetical protein KBT34_02535 [Prevotella sp.]|nr:hypothetical protein [Candidatus Prevotella equi]
MKHLIVILMTVLMSISTSAFASTTTSTESKNNLTVIVIPTNITVKQTVTFKDGKTIELYYQKKGDVCKLYSTTDVTKYKESDLSKIKSTNFEFVDKVEGKCYITRKTNDVIAFAKSVLKQLV